MIDTLDPAAGGPPGVVLHLAAAQRAAGMEPMIITQRRAGREAAIEAFIDGIQGAREVRVVDAPSGKVAGVMGEAGELDVLHLHGMWDGILRAAAAWGRGAGVRYVLRPAGMLEPWSLSRGRLKKWVALRTTHRALVRGAAVMHATAEAEGQQFKRLGIAAPVAVVPNGVDVDAHLTETDDAAIVARWPELAGKKRVLFLSRVHEKKGLMPLAQAWGRICKEVDDWQLVIAGGGDAGYRAKVEAAFAEAGAAGRTTFTGAIDAGLRPHVYAACDLFVLPTFSENFGVVVAEAMASGLAAITTVGAPWSVLEECECGWWIDIGVEPLRRALMAGIGLDDDERRAMGMRGRECVREMYAWGAIVERLGEVYGGVLGAGESERPGSCM